MPAGGCKCDQKKRPRFITVHPTRAEIPHKDMDAMEVTKIPALSRKYLRLQFI
jgi:hypothetical protein